MRRQIPVEASLCHKPQDRVNPCSSAKSCSITRKAPFLTRSHNTRSAVCISSREKYPSRPSFSYKTLATRIISALAISCRGSKIFSSAKIRAPSDCAAASSARTSIKLTRSLLPSRCICCNRLKPSVAFFADSSG